MAKISVVVCVYNEEANIRPLVEQIREALKGIDYELIYVDDGSTDRTLEELKKVQFENLKILELRKNYGQSSALAAGIDYANGDFVATMDGDLQNDPADIPMMMNIAEEALRRLRTLQSFMVCKGLKACRTPVCQQR